MLPSLSHLSAAPDAGGGGGCFLWSQGEVALQCPLLLRQQADNDACQPWVPRNQLPLPAQAQGMWGEGLRRASNCFGISSFLFHIIISVFSHPAEDNSQSAAAFSPGVFSPTSLLPLSSSPTYLLQRVHVLRVTCTGRGCVPGLECAGLRSNCGLLSISWCFL